MQRREFITLLGGAAAAWPLAARAQQRERVRHVGVLMNGAASTPQSRAFLAAFIDGLRQFGWNEGQNLRLEICWNEGNAEVSRTNVAQLIALMPDVILAQSTIHVTLLQQATSTIPVVFISVSDPVAQGFVASVRQLGGNFTGFSQYEFSVGGKWLDLLKDIAPRLERAAVMFSPDEAPQSKFFMQAIEAAALTFGVQAIARAIDAPPADSPENHSIDGVFTQSGPQPAVGGPNFLRCITEARGVLLKRRECGFSNCPA
jgi:putative ABC transport system substrate-binding protein